MYSKRQIQIAEEHGVVLTAIPVRDLMPFDKIFLDTQAVEDRDVRICKTFVPTSSFNCNCHRDVPVYKRKNKLLHTLENEKGEKFMEDVFEVYAQRLRHTQYCSKLSRYRYESDYQDDGAKYSPKKNHIQFVGQDRGLQTVTYTFEVDETVFIIESFGDTVPTYETCNTESELYHLALSDDEIENLEGYFNYTFGSWDTDCSRIHFHRSHTGSENIGEHVELHLSNLEERINYFQRKLNKIEKLNEEIFIESKKAQHELSNDIRHMQGEIRYILRKHHFDLYDMGSIWDYISGNMTFDIFVSCIDIIAELKERVDTKKEELANKGLFSYHLTVDDYYWILYGDKLKRKYREVV